MSAKNGKIKANNIKKNDQGLYTAVVYFYKCKSTGLYYCGATIDESSRRSSFKNLNYSYGGKKIDEARKLYPDIDNEWEYNPIPVMSSTVDDLIWEMDYLERYLISYYDSFNNGYNSNMGGLGRGGRSKILVVEKNGNQRIFNSCEEAARIYTMSPGNVYHYCYKDNGHRKKNGMIFLPIDDSTTMSALPSSFFSTYNITLP